MSDPHDPWDWWIRMWLVPPKMACQIREIDKVSKDLSAKQDQAESEIPEQRHSTRNIRMMMQALSDRLRRSRHVIFL